MVPDGSPLPKFTKRAGKHRQNMVRVMLPAGYKTITMRNDPLLHDGIQNYSWWRRAAIRHKPPGATAQGFINDDGGATFDGGWFHAVLVVDPESGSVNR
jgi:hypothetical protein